MKMPKIIAAGILPNPPPDRAVKMRHKTGPKRQVINIIAQINYFPLNPGGTAAAQKWHNSITAAVKRRRGRGASSALSVAIAA